MDAKSARDAYAGGHHDPSTQPAASSSWQQAATHSKQQFRDKKAKGPFGSRWWWPAQEWPLQEWP